MKRFLIMMAVAAMAVAVIASLATGQAKTQTDVGQTANAETFTGTIVVGHMKGGLGNPHMILEALGADGQKMSFIVNKSTAVTDLDGKALNFIRDYRQGKKVEIKFVAKKGENQALSMHYLE